jgi:hypothetical protein
MTKPIAHFVLFFHALCFIGHSVTGQKQEVKITQDANARTVVFGNTKLTLTLDYNKMANVKQMKINDQSVLAEKAGIYSMIKTKETTYSTLTLSGDPVVSVSGNVIEVKGINYGDGNLSIKETWTFTVTSNDVALDIDRTLSKPIVAEKVSSPLFMFNKIDTWEGAYQDYGGLAWFYLFNKKSDTYGVHSHSSDFWNSKTGNGLTVTIAAPGRQVAMDYSRTMEDQLAYTVSVASDEIQLRYDADTKRRRYLRDATDVWAPITMPAGKSSQHMTLQYFDFTEKYGRGNLKGINQEQVSSVLNTIARIGVIGKKHFGGNSWHTPYGPICLHEQYIAQMGLGINDENYLKGYQECLDYYRDNAIKADGRVWPRWAYSNEDAMPQVFTDKGFYEAQWGYLLDSNPDFVTNVVELYDQTGDVNWLKTQQTACEKALDWIMNRDSNGNGLVEMMTDSHKQKRGSDWIDIIWAAYENAFVNAKLYHALVLWADVEKQLGNTTKADYYNQFADKLKTSFNKSTTEGGFWDADKKCYIHWRDKDGSIHGTNMVTPVNFMAIAYGICDDASRSATILDAIEKQMQKENLFFWPLCMTTYAEGEGNDWQFPFPNYENGDIFLSWGAVAVKAYASSHPELALKYVKNVLAQYAKDGLAFQRYGRAKQDGLGDDILSGNSLSVVGLYQAIYGINPRYNRLYLNPHITSDLAGTRVNYNYRKQKLFIDLHVGRYSVSNGQYKVTSPTDFGFFSSDGELSYFNSNADRPSLNITTAAGGHLEIDLQHWGVEQVSFVQSSNDASSSKVHYQMNDLKPNSDYIVAINKKVVTETKSNDKGTLSFDWVASKSQDEIVVSGK